MSEPQVENVRTTVNISRADHLRLADLMRTVAKQEGRTLTLGDAVGWMLDRLDVLDLP
jgi:hypothetical protein